MSKIHLKGPKGDFMSLKEFMTLGAAFCVIFFLGWFVSFSLDPYRVCIDHPDAAKRDEYFLCKPLDFELHKDTLLRNEKIMPFDGRTWFDSTDRRKKKKVTESSVDPLSKCIKEITQQDPDNRLDIDREEHCKRLLKQKDSMEKELIPSGSQRAPILEGAEEL